jgi:hypothetical protein
VRDSRDRYASGARPPSRPIVRSVVVPVAAAAGENAPRPRHDPIKYKEESDAAPTKKSRYENGTVSDRPRGEQARVKEEERGGEMRRERGEQRQPVRVKDEERGGEMRRERGEQRQPVRVKEEDRDGEPRGERRERRGGDRERRRSRSRSRSRERGGRERGSRRVDPADVVVRQRHAHHGLGTDEVEPARVEPERSPSSASPLPSDSDVSGM